MNEINIEVYQKVKEHIESLISKGLEIIKEDNKILLRYGYKSPSYEIIDIKEKKRIRNLSNPLFYKEYITVEEIIATPKAVSEVTFYLCNKFKLY